MHSQPGANPDRDSENNMRVVEYKLVFASTARPR
jgi:hypothetical protein